MKTEKPAMLPKALRNEMHMRIPTLVLVGPVEEDGGQASLFNQFPWQLCRMRECLDFTRHAPRLQPRVVVCERDLPDGGWKDILQAASRLEHPPELIVTSRIADDHLWAEVLNLGGYDVLAKPLDRQEVRRIVTLAWEHAAGREPRKEVQAEVPLGGRGLCSTA